MGLWIQLLLQLICEGKMGCLYLVYNKFCFSVYQVLIIIWGKIKFCPIQFIFQFSHVTDSGQAFLDKTVLVPGQHFPSLVLPPKAAPSTVKTYVILVRRLLLDLLLDLWWTLADTSQIHLGFHQMQISKFLSMAVFEPSGLVVLPSCAVAGAHCTSMWPHCGPWK